MVTRVKIVLFEDTDQTRAGLLEGLNEQLKEGEAIPFGQFEEAPEDMQRTYQDRLETILSKAPYDDATTLLVDRDLSKSPNFGGLSDDTVAAAARWLAMPVCSYARQLAPDDYTWRAHWEEGRIFLSFESDEELARKAVLAARGFAEIAGRLPGIMKDRAGKSPAKILAALLGKMEYADKIALYSVGDQNRLLGIFGKAKDEADRIKRMVCLLGYWLWDSLLRYPGLLVNEIAAASYLNIAGGDFRRPEVRDVFAAALYGGPFADSKRPQWWRGMLDDIVASEGCSDGLELARKRVSATINPSRCCEDPSRPAGYYCILSGQPVSLENSKGGFSWFPRGADLTRICKTKFDEYGPWLGS